MAEFLVEAYISRVGRSEIVPLVDDLAVAATQLREKGADVRLVRAISVPDDEVCFYLFRSPSIEAVRAAAARAGLRYERITAASSSAGPRGLGGRRRQRGAAAGERGME